MTKKTFSKLGAALDRQSLLWLEEVEPDIADALRDEVQAGADPEAIRRFVIATVGPNRVGIADRCEGAARHLCQAQT